MCCWQMVLYLINIEKVIWFLTLLNLYFYNSLPSAVMFLKYFHSDNERLQVYDEVVLLFQLQKFYVKLIWFD